MILSEGKLTTIILEEITAVLGEYFDLEEQFIQRRKGGAFDPKTFSPEALAKMPWKERAALFQKQKAAEIAAGTTGQGAGDTEEEGEASTPEEKGPGEAGVEGGSQMGGGAVVGRAQKWGDRSKELMNLENLFNIDSAFRNAIIELSKTTSGEPKIEEPSYMLAMALYGVGEEKAREWLSNYLPEPGRDRTIQRIIYYISRVAAEKPPMNQIWAAQKGVIDFFATRANRGRGGTDPGEEAPETEEPTAQPAAPVVVPHGQETPEAPEPEGKGGVEFNKEMEQINKKYAAVDNRWLIGVSQGKRLKISAEQAIVKHLVAVTERLHEEDMEDLPWDPTFLDDVKSLPTWEMKNQKETSTPVKTTMRTPVDEGKVMFKNPLGTLLLWRAHAWKGQGGYLSPEERKNTIYIFKKTYEKLGPRIFAAAFGHILGPWIKASEAMQKEDEESARTHFESARDMYGDMVATIPSMIYQTLGHRVLKEIGYFMGKEKERRLKDREERVGDVEIPSR